MGSDHHVCMDTALGCTEVRVHEARKEEGTHLLRSLAPFALEELRFSVHEGLWPVRSLLDLIEYSLQWPLGQYGLK